MVADIFEDFQPLSKKFLATPLDLSFQQRLSNVELHSYERIAQLESLMENTKKLQTDQLLKKLDAKNNIWTKLLDENILRKFSNTPSQNNIGGLTKRTVQQSRKFIWKFSSTISRFQYSNAQQECFCK